MPGQSLTDLPPVITVKETARLLRLSRSAAYRRIEAGQIEAFKLGERWFVPTAPLKRKLGLPRGGTRRHGKGWGWFFSAPDPATGKRRFYSRNGFPTKKAAQEALSAELARFHNGAFVEPSKLTVEAFLLEQWLPAVEGRLRPRPAPTTRPTCRSTSSRPWAP